MKYLAIVLMLMSASAFGRDTYEIELTPKCIRAKYPVGFGMEHLIDLCSFTLGEVKICTMRVHGDLLNLNCKVYESVVEQVKKNKKIPN